MVIGSVMAGGLLVGLLGCGPGEVATPPGSAPASGEDAPDPAAVPAPRTPVKTTSADEGADDPGDQPVFVVPVTRGEVAGVPYTELRTAGAGDDDPVLVALHGSRTTPDEFAMQLQMLPGRARLFLPAGPAEDRGKRTWVAQPLNGDPVQATQALGSAAAVLGRFVDGLGLDTPPVVLGAGPGGSVAAWMGLYQAEAVDRVLVLDAYLPLEALPPVDRAPAPIRVLHGDQEPVYPLADAQAFVAWVGERGFEASLTPLSTPKGRLDDAALEAIVEAAALRDGAVPDPAALPIGDAPDGQPGVPDAERFGEAGVPAGAKEGPDGAPVAPSEPAGAGPTPEPAGAAPTP